MKNTNCNYCGCSNEKRKAVYRDEYNEFLCYSCYEHYKLHPKNTIPQKGIISYDDEGRLVCHICGRAYDRLASHLRYKHKITQQEYKEEFGLNRTVKLTSENHREHLRKNVPRVKDVREVGKNTRYGVGQISPRLGKEERLQAKINRFK